MRNSLFKNAPRRFVKCATHFCKMRHSYFRIATLTLVKSATHFSRNATLIFWKMRNWNYENAKLKLWKCATHFWKMRNWNHKNAKLIFKNRATHLPYGTFWSRGKKEVFVSLWILRVEMCFLRQYDASWIARTIIYVCVRLVSTTKDSIILGK